jgi:ABC-type multidrug transport system ATPase subunit
MSDYLLQTYGLTKYYGKQKAVDNVCMNIKKGEIYGFIGQNGAGKTTLMKMIMGIVIPTSGNFELFGKTESAEMEKARQAIGAIIESPTFYPHLSAYENLQYIGKIYGVSDKNAIENMLHRIGLAQTSKKKSGKFSLGMKQRLAIGMALLIKPKFLLLDEPMNGLDPQGMVEVRNLILELNHNENMTVFISSHFLDELSKIATFYGIIKNGELMEETSAEDLKKNSGSYIELSVSDNQKALSVFNDMGIEKYKVESDGSIKIFDVTCKTTDINIHMVQKNIEVQSIVQKNMTIEDYFLRMDTEVQKNA